MILNAKKSPQGRSEKRGGRTEKKENNKHEPEKGHLGLRNDNLERKGSTVTRSDYEIKII